LDDFVSKLNVVLKIVTYSLSAFLSKNVIWIFLRFSHLVCQKEFAVFAYLYRESHAYIAYGKFFRTNLYSIADKAAKIVGEVLTPEEQNSTTRQWSRAVCPQLPTLKPYSRYHKAPAERFFCLFTLNICFKCKIAEKPQYQE